MAMSRMTAQVRYVNEPKPGKKMGSLKLSDDTFLSVWPDKLHLFRPGGTYTMDVEEKTTEQGHTFRTVKAVLPGGDAPPMSPAAQAYVKPRGNGGVSMARPTDPKDAERMFCAGALNAAISGGQIDVLDSDKVFNAVSILRSVWQDTFGHTEAPKGHMYGTNPARSGNSDMDDEIRF